jgi:hypothetical protein
LGLLRRKKKSQGIIFDAKSGEPISDVYLVFYSSSGNLYLTYSDNIGRFRINAKPDEYQLRAEKKGYAFPSRIITTPQTADHSHIYIVGENIPVIGEEVLNISVPMDPVVVHYLPIVTVILRIKNFIGYMLSKMRYPLHFVFVVISTYSLLLSINLINLFSWIVITIPFVISMKQLLSGKRWGRVIDASTGKPLYEIALKLYRAETPEELYSLATTDVKGRFVFAPENGKYILKTYKMTELLATTEIEVTDKHPNVNSVIKI